MAVTGLPGLQPQRLNPSLRTRSPPALSRSGGYDPGRGNPLFWISPKLPCFELLRGMLASD